MDLEKAAKYLDISTEQFVKDVQGWTLKASSKFNNKFVNVSFLLLLVTTGLGLWKGFNLIGIIALIHFGALTVLGMAMERLNLKAMGLMAGSKTFPNSDTKANKKKFYFRILRSIEMASYVIFCDSMAFFITFIVLL